MFQIITFALAALKDGIPIIHSLVGLFRKKTDVAAIKDVSVTDVEQAVTSDNSLNAIDAKTVVDAIGAAKNIVATKPELNLNPFVRLIASTIGTAITVVVSAWAMKKFGITMTDLQTLFGMLPAAQ